MKTLEPWREGQFQVHFVHTGVGEALFAVFPDGTSMLLDCGDQASITRGAHAVPVVPGPQRLAGEWVARYVRRVNPRGDRVDWLVVSHLHSDHAGTPHWQKYPWISAVPGSDADAPASAIAPGVARSGIGLAAEFLHFARATDRGYPDYADPVPPSEAVEGDAIPGHVRAVFDALRARDGMVYEPFRVGATDQFAPLHGAAPGFRVRNVCCNGRLAMPDGSVRDLYAAPIARGAFPRGLNENAMSLGMVFEQGAFRFATCGDFSDRIPQEDGSVLCAEDVLAEAVGPVAVAKLNHHGHHSDAAKLAAALRPRAWIAPVWDNLHCTDDTFERMLRAYEGGEPPVVVPTVLPVRPDGERPWWRLVPEPCRTGCHVVLTVPPGGETFALDLVDARDEDMRVAQRIEFR